MKTDKTSLGQRLRSSIKLQDLSVTSLSRLSGVSRQYIYNLLNDHVLSPDLDRLSVIAQNLDVDVNWLLNGSGTSQFQHAGEQSVYLDSADVTVVRANFYDRRVQGWVPGIEGFLNVSLGLLDFYFFEHGSDCFPENTLVIISPSGRGIGQYLVKRYFDGESQPRFYLTYRFDNGISIYSDPVPEDVVAPDKAVGKIVGFVPWKLEFLSYEPGLS